MDEKKTFGTYIRKKRLEVGLTQKQLADALHVAESTVSKWERALSYPDVALIPAVCQELRISEHEFFTACDDEQARREQRAAALGRGVIHAWRKFFAVSYGIALAVCFLCDLILFQSLGWFRIVLCAIGLAACITNLPFRVKPHIRLPVCLGAGTACLILLLLSCWMFAGGRWLAGAIAITAAVLALPWALYALWRMYGRHLLVLSMAVFSLWVFLVLVVIWAVTGCGTWLFSLAIPVAAAALSLLWAALGILRWMPGSRWLKAGSIVLLSAVMVPVGNGLCTHLLREEGGRTVSDYFAWGRAFVQLSKGDPSWINVLVFALLTVVALVLLFVGGMRTVRARRG